MVHSRGDFDCGQWFAPEYQSGSHSWLLGFLSGANLMWVSHIRPAPAPDPLTELLSGEQAFLWMDNWCKAHPLSTVGQGANSLYDELVDNAFAKAKAAKARPSR
jgi:hypothetical protein